MSGTEIASLVRETTSTSAVFDFVGLGLEPGTQYRIVTSARNVVGEGDVLESVFTTRAVKPGTPVLLDPIWKTIQSLALSWTAPDDGGSTITKYRFSAAEGRPGAGSTDIPVVQTTLVYIFPGSGDEDRPFGLRGVQGGDRIEAFQLQAVNAVGAGSLSAGTFVLLNVPGTPTSVAATGMGTTAVQVTVGAPDNDGYGRKATDTTTYGSIVDDRVALELAYKVSVLSGDQIVSSMARTTTEASVIFDFVDLDLEPGTQYRIVTSARNAVGAGGELESVFMTRAVKPGTPVLLEPVWTTTQSLALSWTAPDDGGSAITTYVVTVGGDAPIQLGSTTMYVVDPTVLRSGYTGGDAISYSVRADNSVGGGNLSAGEFTLLDIPATPTSVTATGMGTTAVQVTVIGSDNDGYGRKATDTTAYGSIVDDRVALELAYKVSILSGDQIVSSMTRTTTEASVIFDFVDLDLGPGTQYKVRAFVQNAVGAGGAIEGGFMTEGTSPTDSVRLRLRGYLGGAVR